MKAGPVFAMIGLLLAGLGMVLVPSLGRGESDFTVRVGAAELEVAKTPGGFRFLSPENLAELGDVSPADFQLAIATQQEAWNARPAAERALLGFFNITSWTNFTWVAVGLAGQVAFFGRMFLQWVVSEKSRKSEVPELFWWFSFLGGICLFTYFVWRTDAIGVLGQSTGVVIYARNLRLIHKQRRRDRRAAEQAAVVAAGPDDRDTQDHDTQDKERPHAHAAG